MKELFYEIIKEAANREVTIDNEKWNIAFNTIIYEEGKEKKRYYNENNLATLVIKNEEEFLTILNKYIEKELETNRNSIKFLKNSQQNKIKFLMTYLFVNASTIDFSNPIDYLKRRIEFLNNHFFKQKTYINLMGTILAKNTNQIYLKVENILQDIRMETPYRLELSIININTPSEKLSRTFFPSKEVHATHPSHFQSSGLI